MQHLTILVNGEFDDYSLKGRKANIFSFTRDNIAATMLISNWMQLPCT
ncbi:MAG: hypothetical protein HOC20_04720 [Chloroflexi bacterium]|jgi:hypothetical protein|nr:hypothetical protein [Chloroflexota bacterium]